MKKYILSLALILVGLVGYTANRYAVGTFLQWNDVNTWSATRGGAAGAGIPTASDDVYLDGNIILIADIDAEVNNLYFQYNVANQLLVSGTRNLTISGTLRSYQLVDFGGTFFELDLAPDRAVIANSADLNLIFTTTGSFISSWGTLAPLNNLTINSSGTATANSNFAMGGGTLMISSASTLSVGSGFAIGNSTPSTISVLGTLDLNGTEGVNGGATSSNFGTVTCTGTGTITIGATAYLNANNINLSSGAVFNIANDQSNGWWHDDSSGPALTSFDVNSTVNYARQLTQTIAARTYGNLSITSGGTTVTKNLSTAGTLTVQGDLVVGAGTTFLTSSNLADVTFQGGITLNGTLDVARPTIFSGGGTHIIDGSSAITFSNTLEINSLNTMDFNTDVIFSSTLTDNNNNLSFAGDFTNNGTYSQGSGAVTFDGAVAQSIAGTSTTTLSNVIFSNTAATNNNGTIDITSSGTVTLGVNATLDVDGSGTGIFTLLSTSASASATVAELPSNATITGDIRWQRYFDGGGDVWRNFGVAVNGATIADIQNDGFTISGAFTGNDAGNANLYYYNEASLGDVNQGWIAYPTTTNAATLSNTNGYSFWTRTEDNVPGVVELTGTLNTHAIDFGVTYTNDPGQPATEDGWNLINNPYPASIEWGDADWTRNASVSTVAQVWDTDLAGVGGYVALNGAGTIAPGQSFWVQTIGGSPSLIAQEGVKSTGGIFERSEGLTDHLLISLIQEEKIDRAHLQFKDEAIDGLDLLYDGVKLANNFYNLSTKATTGESLSVNSMSKIAGCNKTVELNMTNIDPGSYELMFEDLVSFTQGLQIVLKDKFLSVNTILSEGSTYAFAVTADPLSAGDTRFELEFSATTLETNLTTSVVSDCEQESISVLIDNTQIGVGYSLMSGTNVVASGTGNGGQLELLILKSLLVEGANTYEVNIDNGTCGSAIADNTLSYEFVGISEVTSVTDGSICGKGSIIISAEGASSGEYYRWYEAIDSSEPISGEDAANFTTPELQESKVYYVSIVNAQGCESVERKPINAVINELPQTPEIVMEGNILVSSAKENNQWYKDGVLIEGATNNTFEVDESGSFSVSVENSSGCRSESESIVMTITAVFGNDFDDNVLSIFPNPIGDEQLTISANELSEYKMIQLYNNQGMLMFTKDIGVNKVIQIDMSSFSKGIYFIHLKGESGSAVHKLLKN